MDKKKLIGTIVGVVFFVALIAGATFAWLTFAINITNNTVTAGTMNFSVNYVNGAEIENVPILGTGTPAEASVVTVTANKVAGSAPGDLTLYINTNEESSDVLLSSGAINYAVCIGTCESFDSITTKGTVTTTGELAVLTGTPLQDAATTYNIYFWLDGSIITENHIGQSYSGYISAEAIQVDTR